MNHVNVVLGCWLDDGDSFFHRRVVARKHHGHGSLLGRFRLAQVAQPLRDSIDRLLLVGRRDNAAGAADFQTTGKLGEELQLDKVFLAECLAVAVHTFFEETIQIRLLLAKIVEPSTARVEHVMLLLGLLCFKLRQGMEGRNHCWRRHGDGGLAGSKSILNRSREEADRRLVGVPGRPSSCTPATITVCRVSRVVASGW